MPLPLRAPSLSPALSGVGVAAAALPPPSAPPPAQMGRSGLGSGPLGSGGGGGGGGGGQSRLLVLVCLGALALALALGIAGLLGPRLLDAVQDDSGASAPAASAPVAPPTVTVTVTSSNSTGAMADQRASAEPGVVLTVQPTFQPTQHPTHTGGPGPGPGATSTPVPAGAVAVGADRRQPVPLGQVGRSADGAWQVAVLEQERGAVAWARLAAANQFNDPAPEDMQYIVLLLEVTYLGGDGDATVAQEVDFTFASAVGAAQVRWRWPGVVDPSPQLAATLAVGESTRGWTTLRVGADDHNLQLLFEPFLSDVDGDELFIALDADATVEPISGPLATADDAGVTADAAVPVGMAVTTDVWELAVAQVLTGERAEGLLREANAPLPAPDTGMEYVVIQIAARTIGSSMEWSDTHLLVAGSFEVRDASGMALPIPSAVPPEPELWFEVYTGGRVQGWLVRQRPRNDPDALLVYTPSFGDGGPERWFALSAAAV